MPGGAGEAAIADRVEAELRSLGLDVVRQEVAPGRPNVVGVLEAPAPGRTLLLCGHLDTVGVGGMAAPFQPVVSDGRLYGRGAQDMKGGVAAMVGAAAQLAARGLREGRLVVAAVVDEEHASLGADALVETWRADAAIVTEPTDLAIGVGHKGFSWIDIDTVGRAAHGSRPADGRDAIADMGEVLTRLRALDRELQSRPPHPTLGTASLHASRVSGGGEMSVYPDRCRLGIERRTVVGEEGVALAEVEAILRELRGADPTFVASARLVLERPPYELPADHDLPVRLAHALSNAGHDARCVGLSFWTDAGILSRAGIPSVLFGPVGQGLHGPEEYVSIDSVLTCRDVLVSLADGYCLAPNDR